MGTQLLVIDCMHMPTVHSLARSNEPAFVLYELVLGRQKELCGPPQHKIITIYVPNDFPAVLGWIESLWVLIWAA